MIRPKKSLGQHFLSDGNIIHKIVASISAQEGDRVIEIGPGTGALTKELLEAYDDVQVVEIDRRAIEILEEEYPDLPIYHQDVLKVDWKQLSKGKEKTHIVGNLPYYITSQILFALLESREVLADAILMMQKEVAERLVSGTRTKDYGILSVQTQLMSTPEILFPVSRHCFNPPPKVESAVVKLTFDKGRLACSDEHLKTVVRTAFNQRRKKLSNALKPIITKDQLPEGFDYDKRPEAWEPEVYEKLTARLVESGILT